MNSSAYFTTEDAFAEEQAAWELYEKEERRNERKSMRKQKDRSHCPKCSKPIAFKIVDRARGQYSDPVAEHKRDLSDSDRLLDPRWLHVSSQDDRLEELEARCQYKPVS